jgi:hypothetical protein
VDYVADFVQNWLEDNVSENLYENALKTAEKYTNKEKFEKTIVSTFEGYLAVVKQNFETELNKLQLIEN